jgi:hypothetical protein
MSVGPINKQIEEYTSKGSGESEARGMAAMVLLDIPATRSPKWMFL